MNTFRAKAYVKYVLKAGHRKGFGVHSPYVFALLNDVVFEKNGYYCYGTASRFGVRETKYARLLHRLAVHGGARRMAVIGDGDGAAAFYMAAADSRATVCVVVKDGVSAERLRLNAGLSGRRNIRVVHGDVVEKTALVTGEMERVDLLLVDAGIGAGNTISVVRRAAEKAGPRSIFAVLDPHGSEEAEAVWEEVKGVSGVTLSIDLFGMGAVMFRPEIPRQDYTVRF